MTKPVLIFPAGMPRSLTYLQRARAEGQQVIGSSSLGYDPAREHYSEWVHLPYISAPDFDQALRQAIADFDIGGIFSLLTSWFGIICIVASRTVFPA